jgi:GNAT superfamily N-acetyltransferase
MNTVAKNIPVKMTRANLDDSPAFTMPDGFSLRWYQPGDEAHWLRIQIAADRFNQCTPELFQDQFGPAAGHGLQSASAFKRRSGMNSALHELGERQCYLLAPTAEVIGTGTAWFKDDFEGARWGRVHWMAIAPEFQGRGLGSALLTAICQRLRELGHERAYLTTSTARVPAIRLYLKFGFEPLIRNVEDKRAWRDLIPLAKK